MGVGYTNSDGDIFYNMVGHVSSMTECEKDLEVFFDKSLKFEKHINQIINKATRILGIVKKTFDYKDKHIFCYI